MAYKVILDPAVSHDIEESIEWYNSVQPGLGIKFYRQVGIAIKTLQKNPFGFAIRYKSSRTALVKKFPFMIHFFVDTEKEIIVVTAILHTSRNPELWGKRE
jgi:mRNA-degrading endonuclease RelE of RelBE toxin-antitoxin system